MSAARERTRWLTEKKPALVAAHEKALPSEPPFPARPEPAK